MVVGVNDSALGQLQDGGSKQRPAVVEGDAVAGLGQHRGTTRRDVTWARWRDASVGSRRGRRQSTALLARRRGRVEERRSEVVVVVLEQGLVGVLRG